MTEEQKRIDRAAMNCGWKRQYPTAKDAAIHAKRKTKAYGHPTKYYRCSACRLWHLASKKTTADPVCAICMNPFEPEDPGQWKCSACVAQGTHGVKGE